MSNCLKSNRAHYNTLKTHCRQGHPFSGDNLHIATRITNHLKKVTVRVCKACVKRRIKEYRARQALKPKKPHYNTLKTHCNEGHPLKGNNLIVRKRGNSIQRRCRMCQNLENKFYRYKKKLLMAS